MTRGLVSRGLQLMRGSIGIVVKHVLFAGIICVGVRGGLVHVEEMLFGVGGFSLEETERVEGGGASLGATGGVVVDQGGERRVRRGTRGGAPEERVHEMG